MKIDERTGHGRTVPLTGKGAENYTIQWIMKGAPPEKKRREYGVAIPGDVMRYKRRFFILQNGYRWFIECDKKGKWLGKNEAIHLNWSTME